MEVITDLNIFKQPALNIREVLLTNTNGYKVTPTFSKETNVPVITFEEQIDQVSGKQGTNIIYEAQFTIRPFHNTVADASELGQEIYNLIQSNKETLAAQGMELNDIQSTEVQPYVRGESQRIWSRTFIITFIVK